MESFNTLVRKSSNTSSQSNYHSSPKNDTKLNKQETLVFLHNNNSKVKHGRNNSCSSSTFNDSDDDNDNDHDDVSADFDFMKNRDKGSFDVAPDMENQILSPVSEYGNITPRPVADPGFVKHNSRSTARAFSRGNGGGGAATLSSQSSFQRKGKSRLMDPPPAQNRSRMLGKGGMDIEEDDPFKNDLPEEYIKGKISVFTFLQWVVLIIIVTALVSSLVVNKLKAKTVWGMQLWKWEVVGLVLICGGLISGWVIRIIVYFIERNVILRKRVLYFVHASRNLVQNFLWLGWGLLAWVLILDKKVKKETNSEVLPYVPKIMICSMVATFLWLMKTLLLKVLTMNFHVSAFFDRIQDALFNQYVIETLSGPPCIEQERFNEEDDRVMSDVRRMGNVGVQLPADIRAKCMPKKACGSGKLGRTNEGISIEKLHRMNQKNVSAWNMKRLMSVVRKGVLYTLDEQLDVGVEDENAMQIRSEREAKAAAKRVFNNVARPFSRHIYYEDLERFLREEEATKTMHLFEGTVNGKGISKQMLKNWVVNVFRERRALALSLSDTKTAVHKLDYLVNTLVGIAVIIICLLILGIPLTHFFVFLSSQVVVLAFMFGNTCKTTFEAIIFLFVMHPFDVGDRCEIEGVQVLFFFNYNFLLMCIFDLWIQVVYPKLDLVIATIFKRTRDVGVFINGLVWFRNGFVSRLTVNRLF
ncbi:hypothetical protein RND81_03G009900 [Saponaria officinalis]|uniref:Mechanosensitive ion channel protein n=1 Tax=Saponaria officinalis TaxID=3572 RepID=A0AAW1M3F9_SAPOF